jgi:hypothetical protein
MSTYFFDKANSTELYKVLLKLKTTATSPLLNCREYNPVLRIHRKKTKQKNLTTKNYMENTHVSFYSHTEIYLPPVNGHPKYNLCRSKSLLSYACHTGTKIAESLSLNRNVRCVSKMHTISKKIRLHYTMMLIKCRQGDLTVIPDRTLHKTQIFTTNCL